MASFISHPIRLQDSLIVCVPGKNQLISLFLFFVFFLHGGSVQGKLASKTTTFRWVWADWVCLLPNYHSHQRKVVSEIFTLVGGGKVCLLSNQVVGFFYHQYVGKESVDIKIILVFVLEPQKSIFF